MLRLLAVRMIGEGFLKNILNRIYVSKQLIANDK